MKKILVFGNSHIAAIKVGMDQRAEESKKYEFHYAAFQGSNFNLFRIEDGNIIVDPQYRKSLKTIYKHGESIPLANYDYVIFAAGRSRMDARLFFTDNDPIPLSREVVRQIMLGTEHSADIYPQLLASLGNPKRLIYVGAPLTGMNSVEKVAVPVFGSPEAEAEAAILLRTIREVAEATLSDPNTVSIQLPPADMLTPNGFNTREEFIRGSLRFNGEARDPNEPEHQIGAAHGNLEYAVRISGLLLETLAIVD